MRAAAVEYQLAVGRHRVSQEVLTSGSAVQEREPAWREKGRRSALRSLNVYVRAWSAMVSELSVHVVLC